MSSGGAQGGMRWTWHGNEMLCTVAVLYCVAKCFEILSDSGHEAGVGMRLHMYVIVSTAVRRTYC